MSDTLYSSCAEVLAVSQTRKDDLATLLDPETGFAPKLRQICLERLADAAREPGLISPEEAEALRLESNTWGLLQAVMP